MQRGFSATALSARVAQVWVTSPFSLCVIASAWGPPAVRVLSKGRGDGEEKMGLVIREKM